MRILAIDYGTRRVGLALSDPTGTLASPYRTLRNLGHQHLIDEIATIVHQEQVERVLVGLPLQADGTLGRAAREVLAFAHKLDQVLSVPVTSLDESFTTSEALERLAEVSDRKTRTVIAQRNKIDQVAAAVLLEAYLEAVPETPAPLPEAGTHARRRES